MKAQLSGIKSRHEFNAYLDGFFKKSYDNLRNRQRLEYHENLPKSYIVEFNSKENNNSARLEELQKLFLDSKEKFKMDFVPTNDPSFFYLSTNWGEFFVDSLDSRFLFFHTIEKSLNADKFIYRQLLKNGRNFDAAWFTVQLLEKFVDTNKIFVEGWDSRFSPIIDIDEINNPRYFRKKSTISIDDYDAWKKYELNKDIKFFDSLPLDTLRISQFLDDGDVARARIQSDGKLTGRGTSFQGYLDILNMVKDFYKNKVLQIENDYSFYFDSQNNNGVKIKGKPYIIKYKIELDKYKELIINMFSCTLPFRLLGIPEELKENYYKVDAIDLHIGSRLSFEISPTFMRIYLPNETCGNSIMRIVRSLQHKVDPNLEIEQV